MTRVYLMDEAIEDLEAGREFYDLQQPGVGEYFIDCLLLDVETLSRLHGIHPLHHGFFRMLAARFPFGIFYRMDQSDVQVFGVLDLRRRPSWIRRQLRKR